MFAGAAGTAARGRFASSAPALAVIPPAPAATFLAGPVTAQAASSVKCDEESCMPGQGRPRRRRERRPRLVRRRREAAGLLQGPSSRPERDARPQPAPEGRERGGRGIGRRLRDDQLQAGVPEGRVRQPDEQRDERAFRPPHDYRRRPYPLHGVDLRRRVQELREPEGCDRGEERHENGEGPFQILQEARADDRRGQGAQDRAPHERLPGEREEHGHPGAEEQEEGPREALQGYLRVQGQDQDLLGKGHARVARDGRNSHVKPEREGAVADDGSPIARGAPDSQDEGRSPGRIPEGRWRDGGARAVRLLQQEMAGEARRAGISSEEEAMRIVSDTRRGA